MTVEQWTGALACALQSASGMTNERFAGWLGISTRTVAYWHSRPDTVPGTSNQEVLHAAVKRVTDTTRDAFFNRIRSHASGINLTADPVADLVTATVDEVENDPLLAALANQVVSVESLQQEIADLARAGSKTAFDVFSSARRLRGEARRLADQTRRVSTLSDLYVAAGLATSLMASTAFDLGHWNESTALARASTRYAEFAGHASLKAWTFGLRLTLANWRNEPDEALSHFERGMISAPEGEPRLRLRYIAARSYALLGDHGSVAEVLSAADRDRDAASAKADELSSSIGGEFAFGEARAAACAAAGWLDLQNGAEANRHAEIALASYKALPRAPYSQINGTLIDIAAARLLMRDRDGAATALEKVLDLPAGKRNVSLTGRMSRVDGILSGSDWRKDPQAAQLREQIATWLSETSARPLT